MSTLASLAFLTFGPNNAPTIVFLNGGGVGGWMWEFRVRLNDERIQALERQIQDLKDRWPAHSVPPSMLDKLDELEEELERLKS